MTAICPTCAKKKGLIFKKEVAGFWTGMCDTCGEEKSVCAERDYHKPGEKRLTLEEAMRYFAENGN